jgi:outer membrane lipoprotein-sorting protein
MRANYLTGITALLLALLIATPSAHAQTYTLDQVLLKMEQVGKTFRSMEASIERTKVTVLVNDKAMDSGKVYFARKNNAPRIKLEFTKPAPSTMLIDNGKYMAYFPNVKQVHEHILGKDQDKAEFLLIGFGQSNANLKQTYDVSFIGEETIDGKKTSVIELKPKAAQFSALFSTIRLWLDQTRWIPIQTLVTEASKDYQLIKFTNIKMNAGISDSVFTLKLPKDVTVIKM